MVGESNSPGEMSGCHWGQLSMEGHLVLLFSTLGFSCNSQTAVKNPVNILLTKGKAVFPMSLSLCDHYVD